MADIPEEAMVGQDATSTVTARLQQQLQVGGILCLLSCFLLPGKAGENRALRSSMQSCNSAHNTALAPGSPSFPAPGMTHGG